METVGTLSFSIELEENVSPGQILRGEVKCFSTQIEDLRDIEVTFKGHGSIRGENDSDAAEENYFDKKFSLFQTGPSSLPVGHNGFQFSFQLPQEIPSSFESEFGNIRYKVLVTVIKQFGPKVELEKSFTVLSPVNLNLLPEAKEKTEREEEERFGLICFRTLFFWCFCQCPVDGLHKAHCWLPQRGYVPGETMLLSVELHNESNWTAGNQVKLVQRVVYALPRKPKKYTKTICKLKRPEDKRKHYLTDFSILVPDIPTSPFPFTRLITVEYFLEFSQDDVVSIEFPVLIGTIPLNQAPATQPACDYPTSPLLPFLPTAPPLEFTSENSQEDAPPSYEMAVITLNTTTSKDTKESQFQAQNNVIGFKPCYADQYPSGYYSQPNPMVFTTEPTTSGACFSPANHKSVITVDFMDKK